MTFDFVAFYPRNILSRGVLSTWRFYQWRLIRFIRPNNSAAYCSIALKIGMMMFYIIYPKRR